MPLSGINVCLVRTIQIGEDLAIEINVDQHNYTRLIMLNTKTKEKIYSTGWFYGEELRRRIEEYVPQLQLGMLKPFVLEE